jgi:hypothetical protein
MFGDKQAAGTILDNDSGQPPPPPPPPPLPTLTVSDLSIGEGTGANRPANVQLWLSAPSTQTVQVVCSAANGTAVAGVDFTPPSPCAATFAPGTTSTTVTATIVGDNLTEADETFTINVVSANGATIGDGQGVVTIVDDDLPNVSVGQINATEGDTGTSVVNVPITVTPIPSKPVTMSCIVQSGTAQTPSDYIPPANCSVTIPAGQAQGSVPVQIVGDWVDEWNETFTVTIFNVVNANIALATNTVWIVDNDPTPRVLIGDNSTIEGTGYAHNSPWVAYLTGPSDRTITVGCHTENGSAGAVGDFLGDDYFAFSGDCFVFPPGTTEAQHDWYIVGDNYPEFDENMYLDLTSVTNATLDRTQATGWIINDDCIWPFC